MKATDKWDDDVYVDFYLMAGGEVGRVTYDSMTGEFIRGEVMSETGQWCKYPVNMILRDSTHVTEEKAEKCIRGMCAQHS